MEHRYQRAQPKHPTIRKAQKIKTPLSSVLELISESEMVIIIILKQFRDQKSRRLSENSTLDFWTSQFAYKEAICI